MSDKVKQPPLIPETQSRLTADGSLQAGIGAFEQHMQNENFSIHTQKAFLSDLRLLGKYIGIGQPIGDIATANLNDFLKWMLYERGVPCSGKTYARRVTTIKVFFKWLYESGVIFLDPAGAVIQQSVSSPIPTLPTETDITQALAASEAMLTAQKPDTRPHLLLTLLLKTGIKKGEAMAIVPNHIDQSEPDDPFLFIRYKNPNMRYKERKVALDPEWLDVLEGYLAQYSPTDTLFTCTARNLEYVLRDIGDAAQIKRGLLSFENLRWYSIMRDYKAGVEPDHIRQRLGISKITWREVKSKIGRMLERERLESE